MKFFYFLFFIVFSTATFADSTLYLKIRNNNICLFTEGGYTHTFKNQTLVYIGEIDEKNSFHSSYSKSYLNLKMPITEDNCIIINSSEFKKNIPYDVVLETNKSYVQRICLNIDKKGNSQLFDVKDGYSCGSNQYDYSSDSILTKIKNIYFWIIGLLNL